MADRLCPGAAADRESWQLGVERDAEAAAHTDNLVPVARASRSGLRRGPIRMLSCPASSGLFRRPSGGQTVGITY